MDSRIWIAVICVLLLVAVAAGAVFFATAGTSLLANGLADLARRSGPAVAERLYSWSVAVNPYDAVHRLELCRLYLQQQKKDEAESLLREGIDRGYAVGPDLYVELAALYVNSGRLDEACTLLDRPMSDYLARRLWVLRPKNAAAPPAGTYAEGLPFSLTMGEGTPWYRLDGGPWTMYRGPLTLSEGSHTLKVVTLSGPGLPSRIDEYQYRIEKLKTAAGLLRWLVCPYCGGMIAQ